MTKKQIKTEIPNEVDILRSTLADVKVKLPGLDAFLLANPVSFIWMILVKLNNKIKIHFNISFSFSFLSIKKKKKGMYEVF